MKKDELSAIDAIFEILENISTLDKRMSVIEDNIKILNKLMMDKSEMVFHKQYLLGKGFSMNNMSHIEFFENKNLS